MTKRNAIGLLIITMFFASGCTHSSYVFQDSPPRSSLGDQLPSPVPEESDYNLREYLIGAAIRHPLTDAMDLRRVQPSGDVNSMDELPASSWYTPRLGFQSLTPADMLKGPEVVGPPQKPVTVYKRKKQGTAPGFYIEDARSHRYLIKLDSSDQPGLESTINFVSNRLFWAFGYHVPEDYIFYFMPDELAIKTGTSLTKEEMGEILSTSLPEKNGIRSTASLMLSGKVLGHTSQTGTRSGDIHDRTPHENLRILRAHYVFSSFLNNSGIRSDNTLDVYVGEPGQGHTVHYLLDFGETFGVHGLNYFHLWDGHEYFFSWRDFARDIMLMGSRVESWEKIKSSVNPADYYRSEDFDPASWKEVSQFMPIRKSQPDDDYWAAKVLASLTREHLETLFTAADFYQPKITDALIRNAWARREKLLDYAFSQVTPFDVQDASAGQLVLKDMQFHLLGQSSGVCEVRFFDAGRHEIQNALTLNPSSGTLSISLPEFSGDYLRVEVRAENRTRPAEFHLRRSDSRLKLVGVIH